MSKHTPGHWYVQRLATCQAIQAGPDNRICHLPDHMEHDGKPCGSIESQDKTQEEIDANGRLIAATPELLEACERLERYAREVCKHKSARMTEEALDELLADAIIAAVTAVAKTK